MSDETKRIVENETWSVEGNCILSDRQYSSPQCTIPHHSPIVLYSEQNEDVLRVAACAPDALRLLEQNNGYVSDMCVCGCRYVGEPRPDTCAWMALMKKAGLR
jgi:hypothetical protein